MLYCLRCMAYRTLLPVLLLTLVNMIIYITSSLAPSRPVHSLHNFPNHQYLYGLSHTYLKKLLTMKPNRGFHSDDKMLLLVPRSTIDKAHAVHKQDLRQNLSPPSLLPRRISQRNMLRNDDEWCHKRNVLF